jgi:hypothetical protein
VEWIAFPSASRLLAPAALFTPDQLAGRRSPADGTTLPWIPQNVCQYIDSSPLPAKPYSPAGPRGCRTNLRWAVGAIAGEIVQVSSAGEYWHAQWTSSVLELYQSLVSPRVQLADLYLRDAAGSP